MSELEPLIVTIAAQAPLVFSERRPGRQFRPSLPYVSGATLRGALAQQMCDGEEEATDDFAALFLQENAPLFRNAYPSERLLPATAWTCKADGGFDSAERAGHGIYDGLIDRLCAETLSSSLPYLPRCPHPAHNRQPGRPREDDRVEALSGFYHEENDRLLAAAPASRLLTRVALNRRRKVAEPSLLYSPMVISESKRTGPGAASQQTVFHGSVWVRSEADKRLVARRLSALTHIGSGAARGLGQVTVQVTAPLPANPEESVEARLGAFQAALRRRLGIWSRFSCQTAFPEGFYFTLLLQSDAILRDRGWLPTARLEPTLLAEPLQGAALIRCYANSDYRGGWNTAWGLPKDTEMIARMGSVYVYRLPTLADEAKNKVLDSLNRLEREGVGARRQEGYGQVRVCDPFHVTGLLNKTAESTPSAEERPHE